MRSPRLRGCADGAIDRSGSRGGISRYIAPMSAPCVVPTTTSVPDARSANVTVMLRRALMIIYRTPVSARASLGQSRSRVKLAGGLEWEWEWEWGVRGDGVEVTLHLPPVTSSTVRRSAPQSARHPAAPHR